MVFENNAKDEMKQTMDSIDEDLGKNTPKPEACEVQSLEDSGWEELPKMQKASQELEKRKDDAEKACGGDMSMPLKYPTFEGAARDDCRVPEAGRAKLRFLSVEQLAPCWLNQLSSTQILGGRTFCRYSRMTDAGKERFCCLRSVLKSNQTDKSSLCVFSGSSLELRAPA